MYTIHIPALFAHIDGCIPLVNTKIARDPDFYCRLFLALVASTDWYGLAAQCTGSDSECPMLEF